MNRGRRNRRHGFTLIEIMVVIVIITILVGIVVGAAKYAITKGQRSRADSEIHMMENALETYKSDNGTYPITPAPTIRPVNALAPVYANSPTLYTALVGGPGNPKTYLTFKPNQIQPISATQTNILDPFGMPYSYYCNPGAADQTNSVTFDLWSYGPDNLNNTADDIANWKQN